MGVDLGGLCVKQPILLKDLGGKTIAFDAYNVLYQFLSIIRQPDGTPLMDDQGRVTSHLTGLFNRTANLVEAGVLPVFVFDGTPHPLKLQTLQARHAIREKAKVDYEEAIRAGDLTLARSKAQQTSTLSKEMIGQAQRLLTNLGIPFMTAPSEGEGQASYLVQCGAAYAVSSQDFDVILFGAPRLIRNLAVTGRRKLPGRQAWVDVLPELIPLSETLQELRLTREQLLDVALLVGTDYNPGVPGIGPKTALELIREHRSLEELLEVAETADKAAYKKVREGQDGLGEFETIRNLFLRPESVKAESFQAEKLNEAAVREQLVGEHRFSADRVDAALARYRESKIYRRQKTLGDWG